MYIRASWELSKPQTLNRASDAGAIGAKYEKTGLNLGFAKIASRYAWNITPSSCCRNFGTVRNETMNHRAFRVLGARIRRLLYCEVFLMDFFTTIVLTVETLSGATHS